MLRLVAVLFAVAAITVALVPAQWLAVKLRLPLRRRVPGLYHRLICRLLRVKTRVVGQPDRASPLLVVANHVSWLDIPIITAHLPAVFVAKSEVAAWPVLGLLARLQRTVFVARERRYQTGAATREMALRLAEGDPVVLFAEGTSSDGNRVLPFRSSLVGAAHALLADATHTQVFLQPLTIAYTGLHGVRLGRVHRPRLAWYGAMELAPHIAGVIRAGAVEAALIWGEPIPCAPGSDRKELTRALEREVRLKFATALRAP
jgi:1-acyl-sn-glycerol-3-phosphate acyltransferase